MSLSKSKDYKDYPRNLSRKQAEKLAKTYSKSTIDQIRDNPPGRKEGESVDAFAYRRALQRAISRLDKQGYIWHTAKPNHLSQRL